MTTSFLGIAELEAAQAQPEITVNEAVRMLEAAISIDVLDKDLATPPASPPSTARYLVPDVGATGAWAAMANKIAFLMGTVWVGLTPRVGWIVYVVDEDERYEWTGSAWVVFSAGGGSVAVTGPDESPPVNVPEVTSLEFINAIVEDLGGGAVRITALGSGAANEVDIGLFFPGGPPLTNQLLAKFIAARAMTLPGNLVGSVGHVGTNPTGSFVMTVSVGGSSVGTITVSTGGVFTFATTAGAAVPVVAGDEIEIEAPAGTDATVADIAVTLVADR
jgi:hypothetical protein